MRNYFNLTALRAANKLQADNEEKRVTLEAIDLKGAGLAGDIRQWCRMKEKRHAETMVGPDGFEPSTSTLSE